MSVSGAQSIGRIVPSPIEVLKRNGTFKLDGNCKVLPSFKANSPIQDINCHQRLERVYREIQNNATVLDLVIGTGEPSIISINLQSNLAISKSIITGDLCFR